MGDAKSADSSFSPTVHQEEGTGQHPNAGGNTKKTAALAKVQNVLQNVEKMQRDAVATDILEAACDHMGAVGLRSLCHEAVDTHEDVLKAQITRPRPEAKVVRDGNKATDEGPVDVHWLCHDTLQVCGEKATTPEKFSLLSSTAVLTTLTLVLAGIVLQQRPWQMFFYSWVL